MKPAVEVRISHFEHWHHSVDRSNFDPVADRISVHFAHHFDRNTPAAPRFDSDSTVVPAPQTSAPSADYTVRVLPAALGKHPVAPGKHSVAPGMLPGIVDRFDRRTGSCTAARTADVAVAVAGGC